jgi:hypothetical protein
MSNPKNYAVAKGREAAAPAAKVTKLAVQAGPTKTPAKAEPVSETKGTGKLKRADRPACATTRGEMSNMDIITKAKEYDGRQGTLRHAIVIAIQNSATVWDAVKQQVNGPGKHAELAYSIKKVDVGFAAANGFITVSKP